MISLIGIGIIAFLLLILEQKMYQKHWMKNLYVSISFQKNVLFEGEEGLLQEIVENRKKLPLSMLKVKFQTDRNLLFEDTVGSRTTDQYYRNDVFQIGGGEKITRTLTFTGSKRGFYSIRSVDIVGSDLFLISQMVEKLRVNTSLYVYPKPFDSDEFRRSLKQLNGEVLTRRHLLEDPFEYRGIREYQPFDDMRSINWKATAKTDDLKVNQKNYTSLQSIRIFLNLEDNGVLKNEECVEASIRIAASLARHFLSEGIQVACYSNTTDAIHNTLLSLEASAGTGQMTAIYRGLSCIDTGKVTSFTDTYKEKLMQEAKGTITCFVTPHLYEDFTTLLREYQGAGNEYICFYPVKEKDDPEIPVDLQKSIQILHIEA